jgi:proteasome alpha subunit
MNPANDLFGRARLEQLIAANAARSLANLYAQYLGNVFTHEMKPLEVEILVAELSADSRPDELYHIAYEGTISDEEHFAVLGGDAQTITERVRGSWVESWDLAHALAGAVGALAGPDRTLAPEDLEVAVLSRQNGRRTFRRIANGELADLLPKPPAKAVGAVQPAPAKPETEDPTP